MSLVYTRPLKSVHGDNLQAECLAVTLPLVDVFVSDSIRFVMSRELTESEVITLETVYGAHVAPATKTSRDMAREKAKEVFHDTLDPIATAARNADRALFRSLKQAREKINELVAWANANGASITTLTNRSFAQAIAGASALVDAENDPTGD